MKLRLTVIQKMTLLPILMNSRDLTTLVHGTTLYNRLPVCVCVSELFKQALIFQWLNFGEFTFFKQRINFSN